MPSPRIGLLLPQYDCTIEQTLAAEFDISRGTAREALRALRDRGLVEIHPHRGAVVQSIGQQRVSEVFSLRALLECYALRKALSDDLVDDAAGQRGEQVAEHHQLLDL